MRISESVVTRRAVVLGLLAVGAVLALGRPAAASAVTRAQGFVGTLAAELTRLVNSGRSETQVSGEFERILVTYGDMPAVAASVLGPPWRGASNAQKQAFVAAFQSYIARKYGRQFREYRNARIDVTGARDGGRAGVLVQTQVLRPGQETIAVEWQVSERSGRPKAVNLIIEGVSMLANERAEVGAKLDAQGGDVTRLVAALQARA